MLVILLLFLLGIVTFMGGVWKHHTFLKILGVVLAVLSGALLLFLVLGNSGKEWSDALAQ